MNSQQTNLNPGVLLIGLAMLYMTMRPDAARGPGGGGSGGYGRKAGVDRGE